MKLFHVFLVQALMASIDLHKIMKSIATLPHLHSEKIFAAGEPNRLYPEIPFINHIFLDHTDMIT